MTSAGQLSPSTAAAAAAAGTKSKNGPFRLIFSKEFRPSLIVFLSILVGNLGYYYTRSTWTTVQPELIKEGILDEKQYAIVMQGTYIVQIFGKPFGGYIIDYTNKPKWNFVFFLLLAAGVAIFATFVPHFYGVMVFWPLARFVTSIGRMSVIKLMAAWWPRVVMGTIMGIVTVSCSAGESLARFSLAQSLNLLKWREVMYMAAGIALVFILPTVFLIRDGNKGGFEDESDDEASISSADQETAATTANRFEKVDLAEPGAAYSADSKNRSSFLPPAINTNVAGPTTEAAAVATNVVKQSSFASRCMMLLLKPRFIILCLSCLCTNIIREILCHYSLGYFQKVLKLPSSLVGSVTALFSAFSALSSFFGGRLMDSVPRRHRGIVNTLYSSGLVAFISAVYMCMEMDPIKPGDDLESKRVRLIALMTVAEFFLGPPVSFLDGLFVIDLVEHEQVSFTSGAIGCIGYVGPFFAAFAIGNWTKNQEWHWVWLMCLVSAISQFFLSIVYWYFDRLSLAKKKNV